MLPFLCNILALAPNVPSSGFIPSCTRVHSGLFCPWTYPSLKLFLGYDVLHLSRFCACWAATIPDWRRSKVQFLPHSGVWGVEPQLFHGSVPTKLNGRKNRPCNSLYCNSPTRFPSFGLSLITVLHKHNYRSLYFTEAAEFSRSDGLCAANDCGSEHPCVVWLWSQCHVQPHIMKCIKTGYAGAGR